jgi:hypothetical protein
VASLVDINYKTSYTYVITKQNLFNISFSLIHELFINSINATIAINTTIPDRIISISKVENLVDYLYSLINIKKLNFIKCTYKF